MSILFHKVTGDIGEAGQSSKACTTQGRRDDLHLVGIFISIIKPSGWVTISGGSWGWVVLLRCHHKGLPACPSERAIAGKEMVWRNPSLGYAFPRRRHAVLLWSISTDTMWTPRCGGCFFLSFHFKVGILAVAGKILLHFCFQALQIILFIVVNRNCEISRR